jgi:phage terminase large subunit
MEVNFKINKTFSRVFSTNKSIIDIVGGRGRGGSHFGTDYFLMKMMSDKNFRGVFLRQAYTDIRDSLFRDFKDRIEEHNFNLEWFKINESEMRITYLPLKTTIISKGFITSNQRQAKLKSLAGCTHILIEEANEISKNQFEQLFLSLRTKKIEKLQCLRIFNPPSKSHWIWEDYNLTASDFAGYYKYSPKSSSDIEMCYSTYLDNKQNLSQSYIDRLESHKNNPEYYNTIVRGLISEGNVGRIYKHFQPITNDYFNVIECRPVYVLDFGSENDPCALIQVKWSKNQIYIKELLYEPIISDLELAKKFNDLGITYRDMIIADAGAGGNVRIYNLKTAGNGAWNEIEGYPDLRKGFSIYAAKKGAGSISSGIELVKSAEVYMTEDSSNAWEESKNYCWAIGRDGEILDVPVDKWNHIMDCIRYFVNYKTFYGI